MTICILFLQVFSKLSRVVFFFKFIPFFSPAVFHHLSAKGEMLMVFNPYVSPFADDSAGMVSEKLTESSATH